MLCTDTDTPGAAGFMALGGTQGDKPGLGGHTRTHTRTHTGPCGQHPRLGHAPGLRGLDTAGFSLLDTVRRHGHGPLERNWRKNL